jgi:hypothetical protein
MIMKNSNLKQRAYNKTYYKKHRLKHLKAVKKYQDSHKSQRKKSAHLYYIRNKLTIKIKSYAWQTKHRNRYNARRRILYAIKHGRVNRSQYGDPDIINVILTSKHGNPDNINKPQLSKI